MRRKCAGVLTATLLAGAGLVCAGEAEAARLALVVGNGAYTQPQPALPHALNDSRDMAAVLRKNGFEVTEVQNGAHAAMQAGLAAFVGKLRPGDTAVFYYAGHGVQGPTRANKAITDDFLLPIDIKLASPDAIPEQGLPLTELLEAFGKVKSGPVLIILDACRNDPAAGGAGLAWPSSTAARNAFIVFAASPGETAGDPPSGEHGLFTGELLKRIDTPGLSAAALFTEVANAVEQASSPTQRPYFAGSASSAGMVITPGQKAEDAPPLQLAAYRQAVKCEKLECIEFALPRVAEQRLKEDLEKRKAVLTPAPKAPPAIRKAAPVHRAAVAAAPRAPKGLPDPVASFIAGHKATPEGQYAIALNFLNGRDGFPASWGQAKTWLEAAAPNHAEAAYRLGVAYEEGLGPRRDKAQALGWYLKAAALGSADGAGHAGFLLDTTLPGGDPKRAFGLYQQAVAGGSTFGMLALALDYMHGSNGQQENPAETLRLYNLAIQHGEPDGYLGIGNCHLMGLCGFKRDPAEAVSWWRKAADAGSVHALANIGGAHLKGEGVPRDLKAAFDWYRKSADRGDSRAARRVGDFYEDGAGGAPKDELQAARWYRKAAEAGEGFAAESLARFYDRRRNAAEAAHWHAEARALGINPGVYGMMRRL